MNHFHYTEWPQSTHPSPNSVLHLRKRLLEIDPLEPEHPIVIHCHDGSDRSSAFFAILDNLEMGEATKQIDVFATVKRMLEQRKFSFTEPEQVKYIYDVIEDHLLCGNTSIAIENLLPALQSKSTMDYDTKLNSYQSEHKLLSSLIPRFTIGDCAAGHRSENRAKNRNVLVVPPDKNRPYLTSFQGNVEATDYVNAVFVDGYRKVDEFICAEWPMHNTLSDFWALVYDYDIKTIVVLNDHRNLNLSSFPWFWPHNAGEKKNYGSIFCVEAEEVEQIDNKYASWELNVMKQDIKPNK